MLLVRTALSGEPRNKYGNNKSSEFPFTGCSSEKEIFLSAECVLPDSKTLPNNGETFQEKKKSYRVKRVSRLFM